MKKRKVERYQIEYSKTKGKYKYRKQMERLKKDRMAKHGNVEINIGKKLRKMEKKKIERQKKKEKQKKDTKVERQKQKSVKKERKKVIIMEKYTIEMQKKIQENIFK